MQTNKLINYNMVNQIKKNIYFYYIYLLTVSVLLNIANLNTIYYYKNFGSALFISFILYNSIK